LIVKYVRSRTALRRSSDPRWPFAAKAPILLRAGARVVLKLAPRAAFQHRGGWASALRFEACAEDEPAWVYNGTVGKITFFPLAIGTRQRHICVPIELWIEGRATPVRRVVPIGRRTCA
jgi:hypothetical protein